FFFSSRRRHTRFSRDWSSDVCSSDLRASAAAALGFGTDANAAAALARIEQGAGLRMQQLAPGRSDVEPEVHHVAVPHDVVLAFRSEERRVGKEGRAGSVR